MNPIVLFKYYISMNVVMMQYSIADSTHGFVGADLLSLCKEGKFNNYSKLKSTLK